MFLDERFLKTVVPEAELLSGTLGEVAFSVDSRTIKADELFVPLKGERVDGHDYLAAALKAGRGALVAKDKKHLLPFLQHDFLEKIIILVDNPVKAFLALAGSWRAQFSYPVVGVTGSVGKTSTKNLLARIMSASGKRCFVSSGNQNTLLGMSLNMARLTDQHEVAIFEVGISRRGEMATLAKHLQPTTGIITVIGHSHMEGLGSLSDIALEKRDLFKYFKETNIGVINGDQAFLSGISYSHPVIKFGFKTTNQIQARKIKAIDGAFTFSLKIYGDSYNAVVQCGHQSFLYNSLAAATMANYLGVDHKTILEVIQIPVVQEGRFKSCPLKVGYKGTIIDDAYNASPESMKAALLALQGLKTDSKKIAVLGDMLELGHTSSFWHRQIGRFLRKTPSLKHLILVGDQVQWIQKTVPAGIDVEIVPSWSDAVGKLKIKLNEDAVVLVKGSNGMQLSKLVEQFADKSSAVV